MGLSRNKVAVSEGAAGSPPFYGESELNQRKVEDGLVFRNSTGRKSRGLAETPTGEITRGKHERSEYGVSCCSIVSDLKGSLKQWKQTL